MIKSWRAILTLLLALCLPLQGVAASGGWWCALQGHDPLRMGAAGAGHGVQHGHHHGAAPTEAAAQADHVHAHHGHPEQTAANVVESTVPGAADSAPAGHGADGMEPAAGPDSRDPAPASATSGAGSCSVCATCCAVAWLPPAAWRTPEVPDATPRTPMQAAWPARLSLGSLDRPPRSRSV